MEQTEVLTDEQKKEKALSFFSNKQTDPPVKTQEEIDAEETAEVERLELETKQKAGADLLAEAEKNKDTPPPVQAKVELTDDELLEMASKRAGRKITSWDELKLSPSEDDKKKAEENRDTEKLSFGLKKGLFNKAQYESFISDSKSPADLVYARELAAAKAEDPELDEKEFKDEFDEEFGINLDPTSAKFKRGQRKIMTIADSLLKKDYSNIYSLDNEFSKYENEVNARNTQQQRILSAAPVYKDDVTKVISALSKIEMDFGGEKYDVPVPEAMVKAVTEIMLEEGFTTQKILGGYKKEDLEDFAKTYIVSQNFQQLSFEAAKKYRDKHEKGVRGIPESGRMQKSVDPNESLTEDQKKALAFFKPVQPVSVN